MQKVYECNFRTTGTYIKDMYYFINQESVELISHGMSDM